METTLASGLLILSILGQLFLLWVLADFLTGVVHWWEDAYGNPTWPILGKYVIEPNLEHHRNPNSLLKGNYWNRIDTSTYGAVLLGLVLWFLGWHSWQMIVCVLFTAQANQVHAWSHMKDHELGRFVRVMQKLGIFQRQDTHDWHHTAPYDVNFCVMTEFLNSFLNKIGFWTKLEWIILKLFKIKVLRGSPLRGGI